MDVWSPLDNRHPIRSLLSFAYRFPKRYFALRSIVVGNGIRIVNPHFPNLNILTFLILRRLGRLSFQIVLSFHGSDVNAVLNTVGLERRLWKILLRAADHLVVVSDSLGADLLKFDRDIAKKVRTIYNGVDFDLFDQTVSRGEKLSLPDDPQELIILSVGTFVSWKGHDVLLRAFSVVAAEIPSARLVIVGRDGPQLQEIVELVDTLSLRERVDLVRNVPHERIFEFLSKADIFVLASRREAFGLVVVEAAAAKVPVVCTDVGGLRELVTQGVTGAVVDVEDHVGLAKAIISTLTNPVDAQRMASNFYGCVRTDFTWHRAYQKYLTLCEPVLSGGPSCSDQYGIDTSR
jgi:glycosyltransferase involved in cell wall biosynthesis